MTGVFHSLARMRQCASSASPCTCSSGALCAAHARTKGHMSKAEGAEPCWRYMQCGHAGSSLYCKMHACISRQSAA